MDGFSTVFFLKFLGNFQLQLQSLRNFFLRFYRKVLLFGVGFVHQYCQVKYLALSFILSGKF